MCCLMIAAIVRADSIRIAAAIKSFFIRLLAAEGFRDKAEDKFYGTLNER